MQVSNSKPISSRHGYRLKIRTQYLIWTKNLYCHIAVVQHQEQAVANVRELLRHYQVRQVLY